MSETREHALRNQALYWKAFAGLAVAGKRDLEAFRSAAFLFAATGVPDEANVKEIIREAQEMHGLHEKSAVRCATCESRMVSH